MLNMFNHFSVPGVNGIVYSDDQDPNLFYVLPEMPSIVRRPGGGIAFSLLAFARDFTLLADAASELPTAETEGGLLTMTTELRVTDEEQTTIKQFIRNGFESERRLRIMPTLKGGALRLMPRRTRPEPRLTYPTWVDGSVGFHLFPVGEGSWVKSTGGSDKPSLIRTNVATYSAVLGQEGVRLMRAAVEGELPSGTIDYDVSFVARIPSLTVSVTGDAKDAYEELKTHCTVQERYVRGESVSTYTYPQVDSLKEMREIFTSLKIKYDVGEFRDAEALGASGADEARDEMERIALRIIEQLITDRFLAGGFEPGLKAEKLGTTPFANRPGGREGPAGNQLWLKNFEQSMAGSIDFTFEASTNLTVHRHPNCELFAILDTKEVEDAIVTVDLSTPIFGLLDVPVTVNADFATDPIAAIKVSLEYDEQDDISGERKVRKEEFVFDAPDQRYWFRVVKARGADGAPKDTYRYRSQLIYKASIPAVELPERETDERSLIIGYDRLDCVNVMVHWGAIPMDTVQQVQVDFRYPGVDLPSAQSQVLLRPDTPSAQWFTYTQDVGSGEYEYTVTYFLTDGQRLTMPPERSITNRLLLNAPFTDKLRVAFVPQGSFPPLASIVLTAKYEDTEAGYDISDVHTFTSLGESWEWAIDIQDRTKRTYQYKVDVTYADGTSETGDWRDGTEGTMLVGPTARKILAVEVVPDLIDPAAWKLIIVRLEYEDPGNGIDLEHTIKITGAGVADPSTLKWTVPLKDPARTTYRYSVQAFALDNAKTVVQPTEVTDPLLVLEL
jgi:hypothetical protein